jgi:hydroxyisourate hydrolase
MSQLTTHILDTATGKPAQGVAVLLERKHEIGYEKRTSGITNADGRIAHLLAMDVFLEPGIYRLTFDTGAYFKVHNVKCFYPQVSVEFEITDQSHYHVPLLISPYGYSTYRGS